MEENQSHPEPQTRKLPPPNFPEISYGLLKKKSYSCFSCSLTFTKSADLKMHIEHQENPQTTIARMPTLIGCPKCDYEFSTYLGMRQHYGKVHTKERKVKCRQCLNKFKNSYALKFHKRQVHDKITQIACIHCEKVLYNKYCHQAHLEKCQAKND